MSVWRVVNFPKENTVEAIPALWLKGSNQCHWPPVSGLKLKTAISKCMPPSSEWDIHEARVIGEEYGDLSVAQMKALEAENTSDLNSDSDSVGIGHRKIRMNKKYLTDSESDSEKDDTPSPEVSEIVMPVLKNGEKKKSVLTSGDMGIDSSEVSASGNKEVVYETSCLETDATSMDIQLSHGKKPAETDAVCSNTNTKDEQFRRQVLRNLSILNFKMDQLAEDIAQIGSKKIDEPVSPSIFMKFDFPFSSEEDLQKFEHFLSDRDNYKQVQLEFSRIGGSNTRIMVKRILEKIMSSQLGMKYSWIGFKKKKNFSVLLTSRVLIDAVMAVHQKSSAAEIEASAKQWLVKSKERNDKENNNQN